MLISARLQEVGEMEVLFHEEGDVDGCDRKEEVSGVFLHHTHQLSVFLREAQDQLQREHSSSSEVSLGILALESQS